MPLGAVGEQGQQRENQRLPYWIPFHTACHRECDKLLFYVLFTIFTFTDNFNSLW